MRQHFAGIPAKAKVSAKTILPSLRSYLRRQAWMDHPPDFQTLGAFRTMYSADFASKFDDSMKGIPQSHQGAHSLLFKLHSDTDVALLFSVPFELYRGEPGRFVIKRYNNERIGSIGREYTVDCPVHDGSIPLRVYEPVEATNEVFPVYYHIHGKFCSLSFVLLCLTRCLANRWRIRGRRSGNGRSLDSASRQGATNRRR